MRRREHHRGLVVAHILPRADWPSILLRQGYGGQGRSAIPHAFPRARRRRTRRCALPHAFPTGTTAAKGLVAL
ncbi:MAG: hypothetical protein J6866_05395, partial [Victivallales bacterium]|nr:hypothetical protein [Victivallales bacterium]